MTRYACYVILTLFGAMMAGMVALAAVGDPGLAFLAGTGGGWIGWQAAREFEG